MKAEMIERIEGFKSQKFGVEIEMYGITREDASKAAAEFFGTGKYKFTGFSTSNGGDGYKTWSAFDAQGRKWKFSRDSSIQAANDDQRCEMVTPVLSYDDLETLCALVRRLREKGAKSDPDHMCGVHIHVDGSGHDVRSLTNLIKLVYSHEDQMAAAINLDGSREWRYCKKIEEDFMQAISKKKPKTMGDLEDLWYATNGGEYCRTEHYNESRYHMLNLHSFFHGHGTVEFRCFQFQSPDGNRKNGLHAGELKAMIQMVLALNYHAIVSKRCIAKKNRKANDSSSMMSWIRRMGLVGDEFKTARVYWTRRTQRTVLDILNGKLVAAA